MTITKSMTGIQLVTKLLNNPDMSDKALQTAVNNTRWRDVVALRRLMAASEGYSDDAGDPVYLSFADIGVK